MRLKFWKKEEKKLYPELCQFVNGTWGVRRPMSRDRRHIYSGEYEFACFHGTYWWGPSDDYAQHYTGTLSEASAVLRRHFDFRTDQGSVTLLNGARI